MFVALIRSATCRHHATELKRRYGDLFHLAQRAGVVVCVMLRNSNASPNDANRLSKYLRFGICTANNSTFDFQTPPLDTMFTVGGGIVSLGGQVSSAADRTSPSPPQKAHGYGQTSSVRRSAHSSR